MSGDPVPFPDSDRAVDVLDTYLTAILETSVDPITDALIDNRGDADPTRLGEGFKSGCNVDTIAVDVVVFDDDIAEIDTDTEQDGWLVRGRIWQRGTGALHRKRAVDGIDHAAELDDGAIADQLDDAAVVGGDGWVEDGLSVALQRSQCARLIGSHQA